MYYSLSRKPMYDFQEQFYQVMTRLRANQLRAASTQDTTVTEVMNGLIVTRPAKKIEYIGETKESESESEPEIIDLQAHAKSKAASVPSINKLREIYDFINRR
jgi:hypothetical protein